MAHDSEYQRKVIKVQLNASEHDRVRLAAALRRTTMSGFCRQVVSTEARRLTRVIEPAVKDRKDDGGKPKN